MKMKNCIPALAILPLTLILSACNQAPPPSESQPTAASPISTPVSAEPALKGFAIGSYVDPQTFTVGGQSNQFKAGDYLYATTELSDATAGLQVTIRINDEGGKKIIEKAGTVEIDGQTSLNIDLGIPKEVTLKPGKYNFQAIINNKEVSSHIIMIN